VSQLEACWFLCQLASNVEFHVLNLRFDRLIFSMMFECQSFSFVIDLTSNSKNKEVTICFVFDLRWSISTGSFFSWWRSFRNGLTFCASSSREFELILFKKKKRQFCLCSLRSNLIWKKIIVNDIEIEQKRSFQTGDNRDSNLNSSNNQRKISIFQLNMKKNKTQD